MMIKRIAALIMAAALMLTVFAGCAGAQEPVPAEESVSESEPELSSESQQEPLSQSEPEAAPEEKAEVSIAVLKGPTGMGTALMMEKNSLGEARNKYSFTVAGAPDEITAGLISGEFDIAALPTNAIATLYAKTEGEVQALAVNTLGVLYILENGESINSIADLEGKTVLASGQGSTAEYVLSYILGESGIGDSVTVTWATEHSEAAAQAAAGNYDIVMLPEPFVTSLQKQAEGFRVAIDLTAEWENAAGSTLAMGGFAVRKEFAEQNSEAVEAFIEDYRESSVYSNESTAQAAPLCEKYGIIAEAVALHAIPRANIVCLTGDDMRGALSDFYSVLLMSAPQSVGGSMPGEDFWYSVSK